MRKEVQKPESFAGIEKRLNGEVERGYLGEQRRRTSAFLGSCRIRRSPNAEGWKHCGGKPYQRTWNLSKISLGLCLAEICSSQCILPRHEHFCPERHQPLPAVHTGIEPQRVSFGIHFLTL